MIDAHSITRPGPALTDQAGRRIVPRTEMKTLGFIPRRADITRAAFREHYETQHAPLALRHIRVFAKYVRNHVVHALPREPGFDCLPEFWFDTPEATATIGAWLASPAGEVLRQDEARFMDRARIASCTVRERLLFGPERTVESGVTRKLGLALTRGASGAPPEFEARVTDFAVSVRRRNEGSILRISLDLPLDPLQAALPLHALISLWPRTPDATLDIPPCDAALGTLTVLTLDAVETPPRALRD